MDRRGLLKTLPVAGLIPFTTFYGHPTGIVEDVSNKNKPHYCQHCGKECAFREVTLIETTACTQQRDRTYAIAGRINFHTDGTKCTEELVKIERLSEPIVHIGAKEG